LNQLEQLKKFTKVVADTADFESIKEFKPQDATTNPSLVFAATQKQQYGHLLDEVLADRKKSGLSGQAQIEDICDHLLVQFGCDILEIVPGRVSTETDARLSYDVEGSIKKARTTDPTLRGAQNSARTGVDQNRVDLGGIECARATAKRRDPLQSDTAVFVAAGGARGRSESAAHLAFVGRIYDWYKKNTSAITLAGRSRSAVS
jgi:transaldolase